MTLSAIRMILCCLLLGLCVGVFQGYLSEPTLPEGHYISVDNSDCTIFYWEPNE